MAFQSRPEDLPLLEPRTVEIYSDELVNELIEKYEIPSSSVRRFFNSIDLATQYYLGSQDARKNKVTIKEAKSHLDRIIKLAGTLDFLLEQKPVPVWMALRNAEQRLINELMEVDPPTLETLGAARRIKDEMGEGFQFLTYWDAEAGIRLIQKITILAKEELRHGRPGRPQNLGIDMWTHVLCRFWADDLGREITHDEHHGDLLTPVGLFLKCLMKPLDPTSIPSISWSLSKHRTQWRALKENRVQSSPS